MKKYHTNYTLELAYKTIFHRFEDLETINIHKVIKLSSGDNLPKSKMINGNFKVYGGGGETDKTHNNFNINFRTLGIGRVGARCGCTFEVTPKSWVTDNALYAQIIDNKFDLDFLIHFLNYSRLNQYANNASQPVISKKRISKVEIPIVSKDVQDEIGILLNGIKKGEINQSLVKKYELQSVISFEAKWTQLLSNIKNQQNDLSQLRQAILQEAIQGKLVPQDPTDEPASVLLERIKVQKAALIKAKKIRKEKPLPPISEDEIPFELPEGWVWCRLGEMIESTFYGPRFSNNDYTDKGIPTIRTTDMFKGEIILKDTPKVLIQNKDKIELYKVRYNDILITRTGSIGTMAIFKKSYLAIPSAYLIRCRLINSLISDFVYKYLTSPYSQTYLGLNTKTGTRPNINAVSIKNIIFPLPPLSEQNRIVQKVEALLSMCEGLEEQVQASSEDAEVLMQAVLQESFGS